MIGFRSGEAACGYCPLSFLCLRGKPLVFDKKVGDTYLGDDYLFHKKRVQFNEFQAQYCPRCFCIHFAIKNERYLCGLIRTGMMTPGYEKGQGPVYEAIGGRHRQRTQATGCSRSEKKTHPFGVQGRVLVIDPKTLQPRCAFHDESLYDCFDEFAKVLDAIH